MASTPPTGAGTRRSSATCADGSATTSPPDVAAEVFVAAWRRWDRLDEADMPLAWLYGVARKCVGNARRGRDRRRSLVERAASGLDTDLGVCV